MTGGWTRRDFLRRSAAAGAVALAGPAVLAACSSTSSGDTLETAKKAGTIKVGIANEAPYGFTGPDGKTATGESVEVGRAVLKALGINAVDAQVVDFNGLIPGLNARQFDMVTAGMFINKARCGAATFSDPDYTAPTAFLVPKGNPKSVLTFDDVKSKTLKLAVLSGAVEQGYAQKSGIPDGQIQAFDTQNSLLQAVATGRADAGALTNISLNDVVSKNPSAAVEVTKGFFPVIDGQETLSAGAFVFRKGDDAFVNAFNAELKKLHDSGEWLKIAAPFGFNQDNVPKSDVTTQRLCSA
ncbi:MAG TPA: ectoine/hydroxyectoine ABC transporter substrate-binding protein EhuB [Pseudonocardia sp.]|jgi:polar amino acid transport system substrate-binding protein|uniref:ectoine/hydroxyectoine ABC transporter substrate-binding protein EhuB n=1 Tax=Pseudonocardia sp. TaxID=60912 RepID=UPI002BD30296|nr:ectoine/hydroxyectoine ABC transporter substrate-binding protein EhuB [Pseudonocardia sp.]HTF53374.1 ectoine/hydroxyectoine ABC transporter substrate-binding protein EhuB [Pseudonocardia sp.]